MTPKSNEVNSQQPENKTEPSTTTTAATAPTSTPSAPPASYTNKVHSKYISNTLHETVKRIRVAHKISTKDVVKSL